jgi:type II secretory pathway pseudopilin PulG
MKRIGMFIAVVALVGTLMPTGMVNAQTYYSTANYQQLINQLQQTIAQLQAQLRQQQQVQTGWQYYYYPVEPRTTTRTRYRTYDYCDYYRDGYCRYDDEVRVVGEPRGHGRSSSDDEPDAETESARDVEDNTAELRGEVDMNDFNNGLVFFVYGEDEDQVEDIEDDYDEYSDIDEDGDDLQKFIVDRDLDDDESYRGDVFGLDEETDYYFQICVEYEDDDDDEVIVCGGVEDFETDD